MRTIFNHGVTLLIAVVVTTAALSIALGISDIIFSQFQFGKNAAESYKALYAANIGRECALYYASELADPTGSARIFWDPVDPCYGGSCSVTCGTMTFTEPVSMDHEIFLSGIPVGINCGDTPGCKHVFTFPNSGYQEFPGCAQVTVTAEYVGSNLVIITDSNGVNTCTGAGRVNRTLRICDPIDSPACAPTP